MQILLASYMHVDGEVKTSCFIKHLIGGGKTSGCLISLTEETSIFLSHRIHSECECDVQSRPHSLCKPEKQNWNDAFTGCNQQLLIVYLDWMWYLPCLLFVTFTISKQAVKVTIGKFSSAPRQSNISVFISLGWKVRWAITSKMGLALKDIYEQACQNRTYILFQ